MPDSIITKMMDRSLPPGPATLKSCSSEVGRTLQYTLRILKTIKPVTMAFTVKEIVRLVKVKVCPKLVMFKGQLA